MLTPNYPMSFAEAAAFAESLPARAAAMGLLPRWGYVVLPCVNAGQEAHFRTGALTMLYAVGFRILSQARLTESSGRYTAWDVSAQETPNNLTRHPANTLSDLRAAVLRCFHAAADRRLTRPHTTHLRRRALHAVTA